MKNYPRRGIELGTRMHRDVSLTTKLPSPTIRQFLTFKQCWGTSLICNKETQNNWATMNILLFHRYKLYIKAHKLTSEFFIINSLTSNYFYTFFNSSTPGFSL